MTLKVGVMVVIWNLDACVIAWWHLEDSTPRYLGETGGLPNLDKRPTSSLCRGELRADPSQHWLNGCHLDICGNGINTQTIAGFSLRLVAEYTAAPAPADARRGPILMIWPLIGSYHAWQKSDVSPSSSPWWCRACPAWILFIILIGY